MPRQAARRRFPIAWTGGFFSAVVGVQSPAGLKDKPAEATLSGTQNGSILPGAAVPGCILSGIAEAQPDGAGAVAPIHVARCALAHAALTQSLTNPLEVGESRAAAVSWWLLCHSAGYPAEHGWSALAEPLD